MASSFTDQSGPRTFLGPLGAPPYSLVWGDFQGPVPKSPGTSVAFTNAAFSISNIRSNIKTRAAVFTLDKSVLAALKPADREAYRKSLSPSPSHSGTMPDFIIEVQITVSLNKSKMWSIVSAQTPAILMHEQGHYDIVELVMWELYNDLLLGPPKSPLDIVDSKTGFTIPVHAFRSMGTALSWGNSKVSAAQAQIARLEPLYDQQTAHGTNARQASWTAAFAAVYAAGGSLAAALTARGVG
jgi:hypothetical protein